MHDNKNIFEFDKFRIILVTNFEFKTHLKENGSVLTAQRSNLKNEELFEFAEKKSFYSLFTW